MGGGADVSNLILPYLHNEIRKRLKRARWHKIVLMSHDFQHQHIYRSRVEELTIVLFAHCVRWACCLTALYANHTKGFETMPCLKQHAPLSQPNTGIETAVMRLPCDQSTRSSTVGLFCPYILANRHYHQRYCRRLNKKHLFAMHKPSIVLFVDVLQSKRYMPCRKHIKH